MAIEPRNSGLNLTEWMRRMGIKGRDQPGVSLGDVQLVQVVSDASDLVPSLDPPSAIGGGLYTATALAFFAAQLRCRAAGGLEIVGFQLGRGALTNWSFRVGAPIALAVTQLSVVSNMGPDPVQSSFEVGEVAAVNLGATSPSYVASASAQNATLLFPTPRIFVPAGSSFYIEALSIAQTNSAWVIWKEFQRAAPPP